MEYTIEKVTEENFEEWLKMGLALWPDNEEEELRDEFTDIINSEKEESFLISIDNKYIGFINMSLRTDYVEGSDSSPVGYVEGIYVDPDYREKGIARILIEKCEEWTRSRGCSQIASDCELDNAISYKFHRSVGFKEANRIISFIKDLD
ncbi:MAG: aminoglycoside 6'-N-acetyltransferase [Halanaerobiales bacterium]